MNCAQFVFMQRECDDSDTNLRSVKKNVINPRWILLDTCSTVSMRCDQDFVRDIIGSVRMMRL